MDFTELLTRAKNLDPYAFNEIASMYKPLIIKESIVDGMMDYDLHQELWETFLICIRTITI